MEIQAQRTLAEKMAAAHQSDLPLEPLPFSGIPALLKSRENDDTPWLIWYDDAGNRSAWTGREFVTLVRKATHHLTNNGISRGDRVATVSHNHWHTVVHYFACWMIGASVVPVNIGESDERIAYILEFGEVKFIFVRDAYAERIAQILAHMPRKPHVEICDSSPGFPENGEEMPLKPAFLLDEEALVVFTSGTTGKPKGVCLTQANLLEDARAITEWHRIGWEDRMMCVLPIHHVNGTVVTLVTPFFAGTSVVLNQKFSAEAFFTRLAAEQVRLVSVVPTLLQFLLHRWPDGLPCSLPRFRHILCGAGPLTVGIARDFEERFGIRVMHGYGLSETTCYSCFLPVDLALAEHQHWMRYFGFPSIGVAMPVNDMDIHDEKGRSLNEGEKGEIVIRGSNVMREYYRNDAANEAAFTWGWFRSGDEGFWKADAQGRRFYFITGRLKELIIRGGINIAPLEIDEVIQKAPGVKSGIAVGFPNDWYGEEVGAVVTLQEGVTPDADAILAYCAAQLPFARQPKVVVFAEELPVTSTGKYQRLKVTHLFAEWEKTQFRG